MYNTKDKNISDKNNIIKKKWKKTINKIFKKNGLKHVKKSKKKYFQGSITKS